MPLRAHRLALASVAMAAPYAHAQALPGPDWLLPAAAGLLAVVAVVAYLFGRRRGTRLAKPVPFSGKTRLLDELDTENMDLTRRVRELSAELDVLKQAQVEEHADDSQIAARIGDIEARCEELAGELKGARALNDTLSARLEEALKSDPRRALPEGHEELDEKLRLEDPRRDDETTVARLNRKLALARRTIAELLEAQQQIELADARAAAEGEAPGINSLNRDDLRVELRRARRALVRLESESKMKNDVISALEGDAVALQEVRRELEEKSTLNGFLKSELSEVMEEMRRLKKRLSGGAPEDEVDPDTEAALMQAMARGGKRQ